MSQADLQAAPALSSRRRINEGGTAALRASYVDGARCVTGGSGLAVRVLIVSWARHRDQKDESPAGRLSKSRYRWETRNLGRVHGSPWSFGRGSSVRLRSR